MASWLWVHVQVWWTGSRWTGSRWVALSPAERERGDVPGFVMVTVMTAGLVVAVFAVFREAILAAVRTAIEGVVSGTGG